jgi:hypothetical protein
MSTIITSLQPAIRREKFEVISIVRKRNQNFLKDNENVFLEILKWSLGKLLCNSGKFLDLK